jgi:hypothetical protein
MLTAKKRTAQTLALMKQRSGNSADICGKDGASVRICFKNNRMITGFADPETGRGAQYHTPPMISGSKF